MSNARNLSKLTPSASGQIQASDIEAGAVTSSLGYTPVNEAGDEMTGVLIAPLTHRNGYFKINPYNSSYGTDQWVQMYYDGVNKTLKFYDRTTAGSSSAASINFAYTGGGVSFGSGDILDDYEEGTWTPSYIATYNNSTWGSYTSQIGYYTKVGRLVMCTFSLRVLSMNVLGNVGIAGLPFAVQHGGVGGGARESAQTGNWFQCESVGSGGNIINTLRRYDNGGLPSGTVDMQGFVVYHAQ